ncbi:MAG: class I SAM-dependent RNA methyltransferase, partial [Planctomycetota bacterium]
ANLWLRAADRVQVCLGEFDATDFGELYDKTRGLPWAAWVGPEAAFPVSGRSSRSRLHHPPTIQKLVKKAAVDALYEQHGVVRLPETGPPVPVDVSIVKDRVTVALDTTGPGLHRRGYRRQAGAAPLKETLAAGLIQLSHWSPGRAFADPLCGSGTFVIEAALMAAGVAPGRRRDFVAESWPAVPREVWADARSEADRLAAETGVTDGPKLIGSDIAPGVLRFARENAAAAGVDRLVHFQQRPLAEFSSSQRHGVLVTNPPYGDRLEAKPAVDRLTGELADVVRGLPTWSAYVLTADHDFEQTFGRKAGRRRKVYNGGIACTYYQYPGPRPPRAPVSEPPDNIDE